MAWGNSHQILSKPFHETKNLNRLQQLTATAKNEYANRNSLRVHTKCTTYYDISKSQDPEPGIKTSILKKLGYIRLSQ